MEWLLFFILAVVQGLTEFLPVSSSGHLAIIQNLPVFHDIAAQIGKDSFFAYDIFVHVATLLSIILFFRCDILRLIVGFFRYILGHRDTENSRMYLLAWNIVLANIPVMIAGLFFRKDVQSIFGSLSAVSILMIFNGLILLSTLRIKRDHIVLSSIRTLPAMIIGLFQALAICPGISRSGSTISAGLLLGIRREDAARFSFLLGLPAILGAAVIEAIDTLRHGRSMDHIYAMLMGGMIAFLTGILALKILVWLVNRAQIWLFGLYTILVGILILLVF